VKIEKITVCYDSLQFIAEYLVYDDRGTCGLELNTNTMHIIETNEYFENDVYPLPPTICLLKVIAQAMRLGTIENEKQFPIFDNLYEVKVRKDDEADIVPSIPYTSIEVPEVDLDEALRKKNFRLIFY